FLSFSNISCSLNNSSKVHPHSQLPFSFTLKNNSRTSAGVYTNDNVLIRTLWNNKYYDAGTYHESWDGNDDEGKSVQKGNYSVHLLSNNVSYTWEGVIGNTSDSFSGSTVYHGMDFINSMAIAGNNIYMAIGYNEGHSCFIKSNLKDIGKKEFILPSIGNQSSNFVVTDGKNVYWACTDPYTKPHGTLQFVFATSVENDNEINFNNGTSIKLVYGRKMLSCIDVLNNESSLISGLAVQKSGNYLFISHKLLNEVHVVNKNTGELIRTISMASPGASTIDGNNHLWIISNGTVKSFEIFDNGNISDEKQSLTGLSNPLALAFDINNKSILICDGGKSQQVKAYNISNGKLEWAFGKEGGYEKEAGVRNDKFFFADSKLSAKAFICFQGDGSFWVGDVGNNRAQHYDSERNFIERIMYLPRSYNAGADQNNPTRVFNEYLEFKIDYSKPLDNGKNKSWELVNNWRGATVDSSYLNPGSGSQLFENVETLNNGHTYSVIRGGNKIFVVELVNGGTLRFTGINFPTKGHPLIYKDGSIREFLANNAGKEIQWQIRSLKGFDEQNNPIWSQPSILASVSNIKGSDPVNWFNTRPAEMTDNEILITFDKNLPSKGLGELYHLGGVKKGDTKYSFKTARVTDLNYKGDYPENGDFDIGNKVRNPGSDVAVIGNNIFWGYHGEFWKNSQANKWQHVYPDGLLIGVFGVTGKDSKEEAASMMAGNSFAFQVVQYKNDIYLYHCDESYHSGIHRWKISNLTSIHEDIIPIHLTSSN
ncbi:MAG: hypothetical protein ACJ748_05130, partial [Flavisolibacter sp.]